MYARKKVEDWGEPHTKDSSPVRFALDANTIIRAFQSRGYKARKSGSGYVLAQCPFHKDSSPSLSVKVNGRHVRCFSSNCEAHPDNNGPYTWKEVCDKIGVTDGLINPESDGTEMVSSMASRLEALRQRHQAAQQQTSEEDIWPPKGMRKWHESDGGWRGLDASYLVSRGAKHSTKRGMLANETTARIPRLVLPVRHDRNEYVGWVGEAILNRHRDKDNPARAMVKCKNMPGMRADRVMFGLYEATRLQRRRGLDCLVITEGPFDQLRTFSFGIPSVSMLGTGTWMSEKKRKELRMKLSPKGELIVESGVSTVFLMMDADAAGDTTGEMIRRELSPWVEVKRIRLPRGKDPGNVSKRILMEIRNRLHRR